jgi:hypothetical protein
MNTDHLENIKYHNLVYLTENLSATFETLSRCDSVSKKSSEHYFAEYVLTAAAVLGNGKELPAAFFRV